MKTKGVCGDYNDVMSDDLKTSSGQQIPLTRDGWAGENETRAFVESFQDANDTKYLEIKIVLDNNNNNNNWIYKVIIILWAKLRMRKLWSRE